jgi:hypothetical protein
MQPVIRSSILTLKSHLLLSLPSGSFPQVSPPKFFPHHHSRSDHTNKHYLMIRVNHEAPHYALFSSSPLPPSAPYSRTPSNCYSLNVRDQVSHPYKAEDSITVRHALQLTCQVSQQSRKHFAKTVPLERRLTPPRRRLPSAIVLPTV